MNSIYGKADEVLSLLETCQFDVLFIAETKIDGTYSNSLLAHPSNRIIRRDRKNGGGGILAYVRTNLTAYRRKSFEPEGVDLFGHKRLRECLVHGVRLLSLRKNV